MSSDDFYTVINDFNDITDLLSDIFKCAPINKQCQLTSLILKEIFNMISQVENTETILSNTEELRFCIFFIILLGRAKGQLIENDIVQQTIKTRFDDEKISMTISKWIKFFIDPTIDKIDRKIKSFKLMKEMGDDYKMAEIKVAIEKYFSEKLSIDNFKGRMINQYNSLEKCPRSHKLLNSIIKLCNLCDYIGRDAINLGLENILLKF
jgi:hypothetical protein